MRWHDKFCTAYPMPIRFEQYSKWCYMCDALDKAREDERARIERGISALSETDSLKAAVQVVRNYDESDWAITPPD